MEYLGIKKAGRQVVKADDDDSIVEDCRYIQLSTRRAKNNKDDKCEICSQAQLSITNGYSDREVE